MTREKAWEVACAVADMGISVRVAIGVHPKMAPPEHCSVHLGNIRYESVSLRQVLDLADSHGLELHLIGSDLTLLERGPHRSGA